MTYLERLLKRREEERIRKEAKKAEREKKRKEREEEKKMLKKIKHKKLLKKRQNYRARKKRRLKIMAERRKNNEKVSYYRIVVMKNRRCVKKLGHFRWKTKAYKFYEEVVEKNKASVLCPVKIVQTDTARQKRGEMNIDMNYEVLLIEKVNENENKVRKFRNEDGKFVDNVIVNKDYVILAKSPWLVEETFSVYGFNPKTKRKDAHFILNELLLKDCSRENIKRVFIYKNRLVIQYNSDFDFVTCKTREEAERLYDILEKSVNRPKINKTIFFTDKIQGTMKDWLVSEMEEKTGWKRDRFTNRNSRF